MSNIKQVMNSWVVVRPEKKKAKSSSFLILPEETSHDKVGYAVGIVEMLPEYVSYASPTKNTEAKLVEMAISNKLIPSSALGFKVGDRVLYRKYIADIHKHEDICFIYWQDLLAVVPEGAEISNI
jgi:co-chaperonin GroES (HSP10)